MNQTAVNEVAVNQIAVNKDLCVQDGACVDVCPCRSLTLDEQGFPQQVPGRTCILCGHCVAVCPCNALTHEGLPDEDFLPMPKELPTPSAVDSLLMSRRSVRAFKDKSVARGTLEDLLEVARRAPTAINSQTLHWTVVNGAAKVHALSEISVNWMRAAGVSSTVLAPWDNGYDFVLRGAPAVIAVSTPTDYEWGKQDCSIALTFLELAAEARGLGICWTGYLTHVAGLHEPLRKALSIPEGYTMHGGLMLGEPEHSYQRIPPRKLLDVQWI